MKKLGLKKETLADLSMDDLREIVGGHHESHTCTPTYMCVSAGYCNSFVCLSGGPDIEFTVFELIRA